MAMPNDPTMPPTPAAPVAPGAAPAGAPGQDHPVVRYAGRLHRYMKKCYERDPHAFDDFENDDEGEGGHKEPEGGTPEKKDDGPPAGGKEPEGKRDEKDREEFRRQQERLNLQRVEARLQKVEQEREQERQNYARSDSTRRVQLLVNEGFLIKDPLAEVKKMAAMDDAGRQARETEIRENYTRGPVSGNANFLNIGGPDGKSPPGKEPGDQLPDDAASAREMNEALKYLRSHEDCEDIEEALAAVRKKPA